MSESVGRLRALGQSLWLDSIHRELLLSGGLDALVRDRGISGVTSNPSLFLAAMTAGDAYDAGLRRAVVRGLSGPALLEALAVEDIREACDRLLPVFQESGGLDGRVSLEVDPHLAHDTAGTLAAALRLNREVGRPNVMIKIPATRAGLPAVTEALAQGVAVNVTLIFSLARYAEVMEAYLQGLERRVALGRPLEPIVSVASFFVSRVDSAVDAAIQRVLAALPAGDPAYAALRAHLGRAAVANARLAYARFREVFGSERFQALRAQGARPQRPLWASTSTKNPAYRDVVYVEELIGPDTVNTLPPATLEAFADHGVAEPRIERDLAGARALFESLPRLGVPVGELIDGLEEEGVNAFVRAWDTVVEALDERRRAHHDRRWVHLRIAPGEYDQATARRLERLAHDRFASRLWSRDPSLWSSDPAHQKVAAHRLGWLEVASAMAPRVPELQEFAREVAGAGYTHAVLLGMGGSSLAPEVLRQVFGARRGLLDLTVLDSTSPAAVRAVTGSRDPRRTLFLVASKSGTTIEVASFERHCFEWVRSALGAAAGRSFVAITDPGTALEQQAGAQGYRRAFLNPPDIGGRYSALSLFGLVPAALIGVPLEPLLEHALDEARNSSPEVPPAENLGLALGAALGELAGRGRDKLTLVLGPELASFGSWIEQLVAESTGKDGRGVIPVDGEPLAAPEAYGADRVFVALSVKPLEAETDAALNALERAGHPVLRWRDLEPTALGAEFLRWEIATVTAGAILGVDPFDEPNVTEAKQATQAVLERMRRGERPPEAAVASAHGVSVEAPREVVDAIADRVQDRGDPTAWAAALLSLARPGDYFAVLAYLHRTPERHHRLERLRLAGRNAARVATTLGYGPRFLHSTGQLHKGGPNLGLFLQLTADEEELPIPGQEYGFGTLIRAQAAGDYQVLERRGRRVMRVHLGADPDRALEEIAGALAAARV